MKNETLLQLPPQLSLPIEVYDNTAFILGVMNGKPCRFLFDSGGQTLVLNANQWDTENLESGFGAMGVTGKVNTYYAVIEELAFQNWKIQNREVLMIDMSHLEEEAGVEIQGIIGFREIINFDWMLDFEHKVLHLWDRFPQNHYRVLEKIKLSFHHHLAFLELKIGGKPYRFILDTGCSVNCIDHRLKDELAPFLSHLEEDKLKSASPNEFSVLSGTLSGFQIGSLDFGPSEVKLVDLAGMQDRFGPLDGITGHPVFSQHKAVQCWNYSSLIFVGDELTPLKPDTPLG